MARAQFATRNTHSAAHAGGRPVQRLVRRIRRRLITSSQPWLRGRLSLPNQGGGLAPLLYVPADVDLHTGLRAMVLRASAPPCQPPLSAFAEFGGQHDESHRLRCGQLWCLKFGSSRAFGDPFCVSRLSRRGLGPLGRLHVRAAASGRLQHRARKHANRL